MAHFRILAPLAVLAALLLFAPGASASHVHCGDTINQDTTLDGDLACTGDGLIIEGEATVDLAGHSIDGSGGGTGILSYVHHFEVRNGAIRGFGDGIFSEDDGVLVTNMLFEGNGVGVSCHYGNPCVIEDSTLRFNQWAAILDAADSSPPAVVRGNRIYGNRDGIWVIDYIASVTDNRVERNDGIGIRLEYEAEGEVFRNVIADNESDGVQVRGFANLTIKRNQIARNGANGVRVDSAYRSTRVRVEGNRIVRNAADGVFVDNARGAEATLIVANRTDRNGDDGIDVDVGPFGPGSNPWDVTVTANRASFNADLGIEAFPLTTDGGSNRAKHNGDPPQCVGVRCK